MLSPVPTKDTPIHTDAAQASEPGPDAILELSPEAINRAVEVDPRTATPSRQVDNPQAEISDNRSSSQTPLTQEQQQQVDKLEKRDRQVRQHEAAHQAAAGPLARGGPSFQFQSGPDGKQYAIGGELQIDTSPVEGDPQATIRKMEAIRRAALAPADPSTKDRSVAAQAAATAGQARQELAQQKAQESGERSPAFDDAKLAYDRLGRTDQRREPLLDRYV